MGNLACNNCICNTIAKLYYKITDYLGCFKIIRVNSSSKLKTTHICEYPYCISMPTYTVSNLNSKNNYLSYRGKLYCSIKCLNSHKNMGYDIPFTEYSEYADL